jgi:hypothetical protein
VLALGPGDAVGDPNHPLYLAAVVVKYTVEGVPDAEVWAWGMEYPDGRVQVVREEEGRQVVSLSAAQRVLDWCALVTRKRARLVWLEGSGGR